MPEQTHNLDVNLGDYPNKYGIEMLKALREQHSTLYLELIKTVRAILLDEKNTQTIAEQTEIDGKATTRARLFTAAGSPNNFLINEAQHMISFISPTMKKEDVFTETTIKQFGDTLKQWLEHGLSTGLDASGCITTQGCSISSKTPNSEITLTISPETQQTTIVSPPSLK